MESEDNHNRRFVLKPFLPECHVSAFDVTALFIGMQSGITRGKTDHADGDVAPPHYSLTDARYRAMTLEWTGKALDGKPCRHLKTRRKNDG